MNFDDYLNEALKVKYVVRKNKKIKKWKTNRKGYRVEYDANGNRTKINGVEYVFDTYEKLFFLHSFLIFPCCSIYFYYISLLYE